MVFFSKFSVSDIFVARLMSSDPRHVRIRVSNASAERVTTDDNHTHSSLVDSALPKSDDGSGSGTKLNLARRSTKARSKRMCALVPLLLVVLVMLALIILIAIGYFPRYLNRASP